MEKEVTNIRFRLIILCHTHVDGILSNRSKNLNLLNKIIGIHKKLGTVIIYKNGNQWIILATNTIRYGETLDLLYFCFAIKWIIFNAWNTYFHPVLFKDINGGITKHNKNKNLDNLIHNSWSSHDYHYFFSFLLPIKFIGCRLLPILMLSVRFSLKSKINIFF